MARTLAERMAALDADRFVGRRRELEWLGALVAAREPSPSVVLVHGPGGIGKSALLRELARRAGGRAVVAVDGRELAPVPNALLEALADAHTGRPLVLLDTFERIAAAGPLLRERVLGGLPAGALVVIAGRRAPEPGWFQGGWEHVVGELALGPLDRADAHALAARHGDASEERLRWAAGSPLALTVGEPARIVHRLMGDELAGGSADVLAVAALARVCDEGLLRDVLPGADWDWLRSRTFVEPVRGGVALHDLVRRAVRASVRDPDLRLRIAAELARRALREPRRAVDLADLSEDPVLRWGFGAEGGDTHRVDEARPGDEAALRAALATLPSDWEHTARYLDHAPECVVVVRTADGRPCGWCVATTPAAAPPFAREDPVLGPWLRHARGRDALVWREATALENGGVPVRALLNTAVTLRAGSPAPRWFYGNVDAGDEAARALSRAIGAVHVPELDVELGDRRVECHVLDHGPEGFVAALHGVVRASLGAPPAGPVAADVHAALRDLHRPAALARNPLGASARARLEDALEHAFGDAPDEQLLRRVLERGYFHAQGGHEEAAHALAMSRSAYFRRLATARDRVAEYVLGTDLGPPWD